MLYTLGLSPYQFWIAWLQIFFPLNNYFCWFFPFQNLFKLQLFEVVKSQLENKSFCKTSIYKFHHKTFFLYYVFSFLKEYAIDS